MSNERIQELIDRPVESLSVELKGWIDPDSHEGIAKIVKSAIALRNHGGGYILIGFNDKDGEPDLLNAISDVRTLFHIDKIQGLITKYSSEPFEVKLYYPSREKQEFAVLEIPYGIKTPVAAKCNLVKDGNKFLICADTIYVRTLSANNTPSTAKASWKDYGPLIEVCFENREADIGRFLRRHISGLTPEIISQLTDSLIEGKPNETTEDKLKNLLLEGEQRFEDIIEERKITLPNHGFWEVACIIEGKIPSFSTDNDFLSLIYHSNPGYTGWPPWVILRNSTNQGARPYVYKNAWEALLFSWDSDIHDIDFYRLDPTGRFFLRRALDDDIAVSPKRPKPLTVIDFPLIPYRIAEVIAVGLSFARAMGCKKEETNLLFGFKWYGLKERKLTSWVTPFNYRSPNLTSYENEIFSIINVPLETPDSALAQYVYQAIKPLFNTFEGFDLSLIVIENIVKKLIERR